MKILVIGSEGNVGKELVKYLGSVGHSVFECDILPGWRDSFYQADINNGIDLASVFEKVKPEVVYHLAAMVSRVTCEAAASMTIQTNLLGVQNVIECCKRFGSKMVYFSTSEVYGNQSGVLDEYNSTPTPNNRYGLSKYLGEKLVEYEVQYNNLKAVTVRPFMFYHEDETIGDHRSAMIRFIEGLSNNKKIQVHLGSERAWFHLDDAVKALEKVMFQPEYGIFNLGSDEYIPTEELASIIAEKLSVNLDEFAEYTQLPEKMTLQKRPNLERMKNVLGVSPTIGLKEGVARVIGKFKN